MSNQNTPIFDTHAAVKRLTEAGMPTSQAEAVVQSQADILAHNLANKRDIELLRAELGRDLAQGLHRQSRFLITSLMGFAVLIMAFIEFRLLV